MRSVVVDPIERSEVKRVNSLFCKNFVLDEDEVPVKYYFTFPGSQTLTIPQTIPLVLLSLLCNLSLPSPLLRPIPSGAHRRT